MGSSSSPESAARSRIESQPRSNLDMRKCLIWISSPMAMILACMLPQILGAQAAPPKSVNDLHIEKWNSAPVRGPAYESIKPAPAPKRDISGVWDAQIQPTGANEHRAVLPGNNNPPGGEPDERNIPNPLPYTPLGEKTMEANKPTGLGVRSVAAVLGNDPVDICDPPGFPRLDLSEFRTIEITQTADQMIILNQFYRTWRAIWTDGRELPTNPEPRWNGYSVGKWADDYTFVVETVGMNDKTWIDNQGRPHSGELKVEEQFHRVDQDHIELTMTIDDPKMYTEPWFALKKFPLRLQPHGFDIREMYCSPSAIAEYNKEIGDEVVAPPDK
jgi:hypothetical protein